jgi:glycerol-3-phosphate dehydrogenase (NAD(P)+)
MNVAVLGCGAWGTALGKILADKGNAVTLWDRDSSLAVINVEHRNPKVFPEVLLPKSLVFEPSLSCAVANKDMIVISVPSGAYRSLGSEVNGLLGKKTHIVSSAKGLDPTTFERLSQVLRETIDESKRYPIVTLIGPSFAAEVIQGKLTSLTSTSVSKEEAEFVQKQMSGPTFRLYVCTDEIGAEVSAALKNVIAIAAGILTGLGEGDNARAALCTRGIAEMMRLGVALGGKPETFLGLSGIGDLFLTATSMQSRNFYLGFQIGSADDAESVLSQNTKTVEGVSTSRYATALSHTLHIEMPITEAVYRVLFENAKPSALVPQLMMRNLKPE